MPETTIISTGDTSNAAKPVSYDVNHPYHLNNFDSPGMTLVNTVFDGIGYPGWRRSILLSLSAKKKLGFINGACQSPDLKSPEHEQWSCVNDIVISSILNALSKILQTKELIGLVQGNNDIAAYFTKIKRLWDELDALNVIICCSCVCVCEGKAKLTKSLEDQRLIQFLMGINDIYAQARGNILMMNPLPSIDVAYSLLLQDENQREVYANAHFNSESVSFMAAGEAKQPNAQLLADFAVFMITGQGKNYQKLRSQTQRGAGISPKYNNLGQKFVKLQQKEKLAHVGNTGINANTIAGTILKFSGSVFTSLKSDTWIIDSGTSEYMCFDPNSFIFLTPLPVPLNISLPNSFKFKYDVLFTSIGCVLQGLLMKSPQVFESVSFSSAIQVNGIPDVKLWHIRLGHLPFSAIKYLDFLHCKPNSEFICMFVIRLSKPGILFLQFNVKVRMIRSDNALELGKGTQEVAFLASEGILHQLSCVATPQQNGIVERKHKHLLEIARGLMFQSKLHMSY
ncbi:uncharacterized protein LOC142162284 [Nicotiana tabacum]|uniref:Uncharacterized protein LOC142162284 n=1 Tax=Nicotiana tabacum TaxID=4097 RepID=A0AC58RPP3_TOBAC